MARRKMNLKTVKSPEDFIEGAKGTEDSPQKEKTFLLRMPYSLWKEAKIKALNQNKTLHAFLLEAIKKEIRG